MNKKLTQREEFDIFLMKNSVMAIILTGQCGMEDAGNLIWNWHTKQVANTEKEILTIVADFIKEQENNVHSKVMAELWNRIADEHNKDL